MQDWALWLALPPADVLAWLAAAAFAAGLARGFSGFGTALIFVPIAAMVIGPTRAVPLMVVLDVLPILAMTPGAWHLADRREVGWLALGAAAGMPVGLAMLVTIDALSLRWMICLLILALLAVVASGWRFRGQPSVPATVGVGIASGTMAGIAMIPGPPVMVYLLGQGAPAPRIRAVFMVFLAASNVLAATAFGLAGLLGAWLPGPVLATLPSYLLGTWAGAALFGLASEESFRRATYAMIALAAVIALPLLDGWLRG